MDDDIWSRGIGLRTSDSANPDSPNPDLPALGGTLFQSSAVEGLAEQAGMPAAALTKTITSHNEALEAASLDTLEPPRTVRATNPAPIRTPPFYAIPVCAGITLSMGGPAIDEHCRVLGKDGAPIPGLFVVGSALGGLEGGESVGYWGGLSQVLITGLLAAEHIAGWTEPS